MQGVFVKVLITGGAGFIGSHLTEELLARGQDILAIDDLSTGNLSNLASFDGSARFNFQQGSVLDIPHLAALIEEADIIYHLAAAVGVKYVLENPVATLVTNAQGTENVLRLADQQGQQGKKKVILASSSERTPPILVSSSERIKPISERTPPNPASRSLCTATCSPSSLPKARAMPSA